ncbi:MAG: hypothetical protein LBB64_07580, partial [Dysgonamonadaceae bacterium]|nr:hypothetical protein [Dysgonamonadaceae bacterium]
SGEKDAAYLEALQQLKKQYADRDFCAEIFHEEISFYSTSGLLYDYNDEDDIAGKQEANNRKIYELCREGIEKYPRYERIGLLKNQLAEITRGSMDVHAANTVYPGENLELNINYRNIRQLTIEIYRIDAPVSIYVNNWSRGNQYQKKGVFIDKKKFVLNGKYPYLYADTLLKIPAPGLGNYEYLVYSDSVKEETANHQFSVSRLATVSKVVDGEREFLVVDRLSGKPVEGARIRFYKRKGMVLELAGNETVVTDRLGLATAKNNQDVSFYQVSSGNDTALIISPVPWISSYKPDNKSRRILSLFTDRGIYRPGQTVYFKGIAYETGGNALDVISGQPYTLTLCDANGKEIASKDFTTNEFGSIAGEFVLPSGLLNGNFSIQSKDNAYYSFRVEEYKRPSFDILFDKNESAYRLGDKVKVSGKARTFSGVDMQNASLRYRVSCQNHWLFSPRWRQPLQLAEGEMQTGEDGSFEIVFTAEKAFEDNDRKLSYTFTIEATITGSNGETQSAQTSVHIGDKLLYFSLEGLDEIVDKDRLPSVKSKALNLNGNSVPAQGTYEIYSLKIDANDKFDWEAGDWKPDKLIYSGHFETGKDLDISRLKSSASGRYRLSLHNSDTPESEGEVFDFTLSSFGDQRPPVPVYDWLMTPKTTCETGEKAEISYGSSAKNVYVLYEIFQNSKKLSASRFVLNNENRKFEIPFLETYGDGITLVFTFIKDNRVFTREVNIYRKQPDKKLDLKMEVFRDRLLPGQSEEWKISVRDAQANPVLAELLAGMYDASLDKIYRHSWNFNPLTPVYLSAPRPNNGSEFATSITHLDIPAKNYSIPDLRFDAFNWFGWNIGNEIVVYRRGMQRQATVAGATVKGAVTIGADLAEQENAL